MNIDDLFKYSFVISVDDKRYNIYKNVFEYFKLPLSKKICNLIDGQTKTHNCGYNHLQCVKYSKKNNYPYCLIFEDDAYPRNDIIECIQDLKLYYENVDIDLLYIGCYVVNESTEDYEIHRCVNKQIGSHAYIVYNNFYDNFIDIVENDSYVINNIDFIYKYTNKSYYYKKRLFEQYTPKSVHVDHIHKEVKPGKFMFEAKFGDKEFIFKNQKEFLTRII